MDTDVLFLRPIDDIWRFLKEFNSTQLAAMAPEHEIPKIGWYSRFARHPYYGTTGVNSGVMLMNLTRIRNTQFKVRNGQNATGHACTYFLIACDLLENNLRHRGYKKEAKQIYQNPRF